MKSLNRTIFTIISITFLSTNLYASATPKVIQLHVNGMESPACPILLKSAVSKIEGVSNVTASLADHSATITFDSAITTIETIRDTIEAQVGFSTELNR